jgi:isocitrate/isopropylmalate dehydrogenase
MTEWFGLDPGHIINITSSTSAMHVGTILTNVGNVNRKVSLRGGACMPAGFNGLALMEAVHGTVPDIAGKNLANTEQHTT